MQIGFHICSTLIAAVFQKSLHLTQAGRKRFTVGKITNIMTTDVDALQQICPQVHALLWSAPIQIVVVISILYQQLGIASVFASIVLLGMFPVQAHIMRCLRNF
jgi:ABC-type transport system involved in cytochrome bd biosynthesis fused ATPase/permease subunit